MFFGQCIDFQVDLLLERSRWSSYIQRTDDSVAVMPLSQKTVLRQVFSSCCCFSYFMVNAVSNSRFSCIEGKRAHLCLQRLDSPKRSYVKFTLV